MKNQLISWIRKWQKRKDKSALLNLYNAVFFKTRSIILKHYYYYGQEQLVDQDDLTQVLDATFIKCLNNFKINDSTSDQAFEIYFYTIAKFDFLHEYRILNQKGEKILADYISSNKVMPNVLELKNSYEFDEDFVLRDLNEPNWQDEINKQKHFLYAFYKKISVKLNKKILFYKLRYLKSNEIAQRLNIDAKEVNRRWCYLKKMIFKNYNLFMNKKKMVIDYNK